MKVTRNTLLLIFCGLVLGCALTTLWQRFQVKPADIPSPEDLAALPDSAVPVPPGPWGNLEILPIFIEPPDEYLRVVNFEEGDRRWRFAGFTPDQLLSLFQSADLTASQRSELSDTSKWEKDEQAIYVKPSRELILSLSPAARKTIYTPLFPTIGNVVNTQAAVFPADRFPDYFVNSGLSDETIALVKKLSFPYGRLILFCDAATVLDTLKTPEQKIRLLKTIWRQPTLLVRLHITPDSDINELEHYWIRAGWGLDLRPMLESLSRLPKGARIDLVELLPPMPSADIYTYPFPSIKPADQHKDCRWTALNFFRDIPDDRFTDPSVVRQTLLTDYYPVESDPRYGDVVAVTNPHGDIIHLAIYIAANIVYTKNSANFNDPFMLMTMPEMLEHFCWQIPEGQSLGVQFLRNKYY